MKKSSKKITKKSKPFSRLSKSEKRVAIAKDVLGQLKLKKIVAERGVYVDIPLLDNEEGKQLQSLLKKKQCNCCALGSCFVSLVRKENKFIIKHKHIRNSIKNGYIGKEDFRSRLKKYFTQLQLDLIESAFEGNVNHTDGDTTSDKFSYAHKFHDKFRTIDKSMTKQQQNDCLVAIMKNIIANKGTFNP